MAEQLVAMDVDLTKPVAGRPLRVVLLTFYNYASHALRIFHPLLKQRGHEVHSIFFKDSFTFGHPTAQEEEMVVSLVEQIKPDVVAVCVWSTYFRLAARLSQRIKERAGPVIIWGGIHPQVRPEDSLQYADIVARSEGELVLADFTDRISLGQDYTDVKGCWVRAGNEIVRNPPHFLIPDLDVLPLPDFSPENKHYLGNNEWRDAERWEREGTIAYDVMTARGCPFECTFCIHNYTRKATVGLGTYIRRRSVDHVMKELKAALEHRPGLKMISISDDIFAPPRPWVEEFCQRYKQEIGLPFVIWAYPGMVDTPRIRLLADAGLWAATMGIQSGSERIRRDCYERETPNTDIIRACEVLAEHGVLRNLDFIGDNPYETDDDKYETLELLATLPKPFFFNYFSLTFFPGVELTDRAIRDGHIQPDDVEDVAEKGYTLWGGTLSPFRSFEALRWDVAYMMAVYRVPFRIVRRLVDLPLYRKRVDLAAMCMRGVRSLSHQRARLLYHWSGRLPFMSDS